MSYNMPKVTVIIPIYGVEKYIERCARSLFEQTLDDMEFIFVNDCTQDGSIEILKNIIPLYPSRLHQITIINHYVNKGLPIARHSGIQVAKGEYIAHCDSDDWVLPETYEKLYELAKTKNADIVVCDYFKSDGSQSSREKGFKENIQLSLLSQMLTKQVPATVWNKMVRRCVYQKNNIKYPTNNMGEDIALMTQLLLCSNSVEYLNLPLYNYFINATSLSNNNNDTPESTYKKFKQAISNQKIVENAFAERRLDRDTKLALITYKFFESKLIYPFIGTNSFYYSEWKLAIKGLLFKILINPYIKRKYKLMYILSYIKFYLHNK